MSEGEAVMQVIEPNITTAISKEDDNKMKLLCLLDGFYPKNLNIKWLEDNTLVREQPVTNIFENQDKRSFTAVSEISIEAQRWNQGKNFTCEATHNSKDIRKSSSKCTAHPSSKPLIRLEKPRLESILTDSQVTASCIVESAADTQVSWWKNGQNQMQTPTVQRDDQTLVSKLTILTADWKQMQTLTCRAEKPCVPRQEETLTIIEPVPKPPTVLIRRTLEDVLNGENAVLECVARDPPSGEIAITLQDNNAKILEAQYVNLPKGLQTISARFTVPNTHQTKDKRFTCQVQISHSQQWTSSDTANIFDDPSVELLVVDSLDKSVSKAQKLLCSGTGTNPEISWLPRSVGNGRSEKTMQKDGRVKVINELLVLQQDWNQEITCEVKDRTNRVQKKSPRLCAAHASSKPLIRLEKPRLESILTDSQVTASCIVEAAADTQVSWLNNRNMKMQPPTEQTVDQTLVSKLTISTEDWKKLQTLTCRAEKPCFPKQEETLQINEPVPKTPTVLIRRTLEDVNGENAVLECVARDPPSGEIAITLQANNAKILEAQYVNVPEGLQTISARFSVPNTHQTKDKRFTCQVQISHSQQWTSSDTANIFDDPSVELLVVDSLDKSVSTAQKLLCSGTGTNPEISWLPRSVGNDRSEQTMQKDGRVKVISELLVPQQDWNKKVTFTCEVMDQNKQVQQSTSFCAVTPASAQRAQVYLLGPTLSDMRSGDEVSVTCLLLGYKLKDFLITWRVGKDNSYQSVTTEAPKDHANGTQSIQSTLKVPAAQWNAYAVVTCEVQHVCSQNKQQQVISKTKDLKQPTVRIIQPSEEDPSGSQSSALLCLISGFHPAEISVHWKLNGYQLDATHFTNSPVGTSPTGLDYFMYSTLKLSAREDGTYDCIVNHQSSEKPIVQTTNNIYGSLQKSSLTVEVLQGQDMLVCLVNNYSPSAINITWLMNGASVQHKYNTTSPAKGPDGKFSVKSSLYFPLSQWRPGATYTCSVNHVTGTINRSANKPENIRDIIFVDGSGFEETDQDWAEETWNMACAFIGLFIVSLIYGCAVTLVKVKVA